MNLNDLTVMQLKSVLKKLEQKTSGNKAELISRLQQLDEEVVSQNIEEVMTTLGAAPSEGAGQERSDASTSNDSEVRKQLEEQVSCLSGAVELLTAQLQTLRSSMTNALVTTMGMQSSFRQSSLSLHNTLSYKQSKIQQADTQSLSSILLAAPLYGQLNSMTLPQAPPTFPFSTTPWINNTAYGSQLISTQICAPSSTQTQWPTFQFSTTPWLNNTPYGSQPIPTQICVPSSTQTQWPTFSPTQANVSLYTQQQTTQMNVTSSSPSNVEPMQGKVFGSQPNDFTTSVHPVSLQETMYVRARYTPGEVAAVLPEFYPWDSAYSLILFIERIEQLRNLYNWEDTLLTFAVLSKLKGVSKQWADAQPVFKTLSEFVGQFLTDFPYFKNSADVHIRLMNTKMVKGGSVVEFYYKVISDGAKRVH
ncbi:PREDICTED: uncharacterized protein LOC108358121 [Rhagoletis zephyria]|uniref:uncharacterized protein LOC108358121 n=1 Tax=Rhagoletis zephyria TaxID=28612 RepID=UPI0008113BBA|nr:PREDICTED: uncharacterized protein LOC108358121 [Rhagoletis zephyria]